MCTGVDHASCFSRNWEQRWTTVGTAQPYSAVVGNLPACNLREAAAPVGESRLAKRTLESIWQPSTCKSIRITCVSSPTLADVGRPRRPPSLPSEVCHHLPRDLISSINLTLLSSSSGVAANTSACIPNRLPRGRDIVRLMTSGRPS